MIIFKSLFRKKITRIYLFIVTSIFLAIGILLLARNHYIVEGNKNYDGSYFQFESSLNELEKIKNGDNIKEVTVGLKYEFTPKFENASPITIELMVDDKLKNDEVITWKGFEKWFNSPDINMITIEKNNINLDLNVKENYDSTGDNGTFISQEAFDKLYDGKESVIYRAIVSDYFKQNKTEKWLEDNINISNVQDAGNGILFHEVSKARAPLFGLYVMLFTFLSIALGIIFAIILVYTIVNIIIDEKKNSVLLKHLGYKNKKILITTIIKIALILLIPFIISSIVLIPIYIIW